MAVPLIPLAIGIGIAMAGGGAAYAVQRALKKQSGKTLTILGESRAGKTTLCRLLVDGILDTDPSQTLVDRRFTGQHIRLADGTQINLGDIYDVPGDMTAFKTWRRSVRDSDSVLYLLRSHDLRSGNGTARERSRRDLQQIRLWFDELSAESMKVPRLVLVFTHGDLDPVKTAKTSEYTEALLSLAELKPIVGRLSQVTRMERVAGAMNTTSAAMRLRDDVARAL